mgnify:CR=1 FL=1
MSTGIIVLERVASGVQVPIVVQELGRVGYDRIRREELADLRVVVPGVVVEQPRRVRLLAGEVPLAADAAARVQPPAVGVVALVGYDAAVRVRLQHDAAQLIGVQPGEHAALSLGDGGAAARLLVVGSRNAVQISVNRFTV